MATLKACTVVEQNGNTIAGVQVDSATYAGTNIAADITIRVGRNAPLYQIVGTQTASRISVSLDTGNAYHGAQVIITRNTLTVGTSLVDVYSGAAGTGFATTTAIASGTGAGVFAAAFDGVAQVWR